MPRVTVAPVTRYTCLQMVTYPLMSKRLHLVSRFTSSGQITCITRYADSKNALSDTTDWCCVNFLLLWRSPKLFMNSMSVCICVAHTHTHTHTHTLFGPTELPHQWLIWASDDRTHSVCKLYVNPIKHYENHLPFSYACQGCIYLIKNTVNTVILWHKLLIKKHVFIAYTIPTPLAGTPLSWTCVQQLADAGDYLYKVLNKDVFLTQMHRFTSEGLYYSPWERCCYSLGVI